MKKTKSSPPDRSIRHLIWRDSVVNFFVNPFMVATIMLLFILVSVENIVHPHQHWITACLAIEAIVVPTYWVYFIRTIRNAYYKQYQSQQRTIQYLVNVDRASRQLNGKLHQEYSDLQIALRNAKDPGTDRKNIRVIPIAELKDGHFYYNKNLGRGMRIGMWDAQSQNFRCWKGPKFGNWFPYDMNHIDNDDGLVCFQPIEDISLLYDDIYWGKNL